MSKPLPTRRATASIPPAPNGRHALADLYGVDESLLQDAERLLQLLSDALDDNGFHQLSQHSHTFPDPGGVTGFVLLSESHAAFHSYPEYGYIAVDVFSCGMASPEPVVQQLQRALEADTARITVADRGPAC